MTGEEAIYYLKNITCRGTRLGLERTQELLRLMGNPEKKLRIVHIAGTNGKGSVTAMLTSVLIKAGYKTGAYTSPALMDFNEQISVNGKSISDEALGRLTERVKSCAEKMDDPPTEFETVTAAAFAFFADEKCDAVVIETGMGGRLDSTNVIPAPEAAVICSIGIDHTNMLGDTLEQIAAEKAGIIKNGCDVVLYKPDCREVLKVIESECKKNNASVHIADFSKLKRTSDSVKAQVFSYKEYSGLEIRLLGEHQLKNAAVAIETAEVLGRKGFNISKAALKQGLYEAKWPGRFQIICESPFFIADGAHNPQCAESLCAALDNYFPDKRVIFIMGVLADKDYMSMLKLFSARAEVFYAVTVDNPRALKAEELAKKISLYNRRAVTCQSVYDAVKRAFEGADSDSVICSAGSLYMTGEIINAVKRYTGAEN